MSLFSDRFRIILKEFVFHWLAPLDSKENSNLKKELHCI